MGLIPMAIGDANLIGLPYAPMGRAMIGGMVTGTLTTPLMVSLFYSYLDDFSGWWRRYIGLYRQR